MDFRESPEHARFRLEVRRWLEKHLPAGWEMPGYRGPDTAAERMRFTRWWQGRLFEGGWSGLAWPKAYGGRELGILEQMIWGEEYARAWAPDLISLGVGIGLTGPVLIAKGKDWQRRAFLRKILTGEQIWCQGFSEPGAGSDLAALRTRGEVEADSIVVTGQKIWTSFAQYADWCILVVRTDPDAERKHDGITFLLVDMQSPGIEIRPLNEMTGEDWFNEVFFDVCASRSRTWWARSTAAGTSSSTRSRTSAPRRRRMRASKPSWRCCATSRAACRAGAASRRRSRDPPAARALHDRGDGAAGERASATSRRSSARGIRGRRARPRSSAGASSTSASKNSPAGSSGRSDCCSRAIRSPPTAGHWAHEQLWSRAATIYAGTSEVQRNIIAERVLRLPR